MAALKTLSVVTALCLLTSTVFGWQEDNLARLATVVASESLNDFAPQKAIDGNPESRWSGIPGHNTGVWFELDWPSPQLIGEVLVRQYDRFSTQWDFQVWDDAVGSWKLIKHHGNSRDRLTKDVLMRLAPVRTSKLRIANIENGPSFNEIEVYSNPYRHPLDVEVASDIRGNMIGVITDTFGACPAELTELKISGTNPSGTWLKKATSDVHGIFSIPLPLGAKGVISVVGPGGFSKRIDAANLQRGLTPVSLGTSRAELGGQWKFSPAPAEGFWRSGFDDRGWASIPVPAHWEMHGFRTDVAGYRRVFTAPPGRGRLKLRFDGVYSGADVWVNGKHVAYHEGGFTPFEADISDVIVPGANVLAVRAKEHTVVSDRLDHMSLYADFPLGGIIRMPYLFRVDDVHVGEITHQFEYDKQHRVGMLRGDFAVTNESNRNLGVVSAVVSLTDLGGVVVASGMATKASVTSWQNRTLRYEIKLTNPKLWSAETPNLYLLKVNLLPKGGKKAEFVERTGLRETKVEGTSITINGSPVKFRGTCHHDSHPLMGRAVTPAITRLDLKLIKDANLNSLRTSHYPPIPELLDIADEMGLYVEDEASFCWVDASDDLRNTPRIMQLTAELIARDRNHPSVFQWSICNESQFGYGFERSHELARKADPSRPTSAAISKWLEVATLHNPISLGGIQRNAGIDRPLLWDESFGNFQGIFNDVAELWIDPGMRDYYVEPLLDVYKAFMTSKTVQGSMIWAWSDDLFCVPGRSYEYGRGTTQSHFVDGQYKIPGRGIVGDAPWGVVDGWRRPKPELWITKKLHSPIKLSESRIMSIGKDGVIRIPVENQYDFLNLSQINISYTADSRRGVVVANVSPRSKGELVVRGLAGVKPGTDLNLVFKGLDGRLVDQFKIPLGAMPPAKPLVASGGSLKIAEESWLAGDTTRITGSGFELVFDRNQGYLRRCVVGNQPVLAGFPGIHVLPTSSPTLPIPLSVQWTASSFEIKREGVNVRVNLQGHYPQFEGGYSFLIKPSGVIDGHFSFKYTGDDMLAREIGWNLDLVRECDTLEWNRLAEWNVYPADHIGRPHGIATALVELKQGVGLGSWSQDSSPMGTNDFRSTKRHILNADLRASNGTGVKVISDGKHAARATVQPDRTTLAIDDWFGGTNVGWGEWTTNYGVGRALKKGEVLDSNITLKLHR